MLSFVPARRRKMTVFVVKLRVCRFQSRVAGGVGVGGSCVGVVIIRTCKWSARGNSWTNIRAHTKPTPPLQPHEQNKMDQNEKAYQKQTGVNVGFRKDVKASKVAPGKFGKRYYKSIGLGFKTPRSAIEGTYIDKKCPFTGNISIRGRILSGVVKSTKMTRTITIRRDYFQFIRKYQRYEKRHKMLSAHVSPCFRVREGDKVVIGQCRPLSKTVRFNVLKVIPAGGASEQAKAFATF